MRFHADPDRIRLVFVILLGTSALLFGNESQSVDREVSDQVRVAMLRAVPVKWNLEANFEVFRKGVALAARDQAEIFITPECWLDGYASPDDQSTPQRLREIAQDFEKSAYLREVADLALRHRLFICFGFTSLEDGRIYNAAGLWGADGRRIGVYRKTHLQNHDLQYSSGQALPVWDTPWGPVGIMICADRRWPETTRTLRLQGARLILNPTYGFHNDLNEAMMRTRAFENQCYIAFTHPKQSLVTGPRGKILARADLSEDEKQTPGILIFDMDLTRATDDNHLRDRRPGLYRIITNPDAATSGSR